MLGVVALLGGGEGPMKSGLEPPLFILLLFPPKIKVVCFSWVRNAWSDY